MTKILTILEGTRQRGGLDKGFYGICLRIPVYLNHPPDLLKCSTIVTFPKFGVSRLMVLLHIIISSYSF